MAHFMAFSLLLSAGCVLSLGAEGDPPFLRMRVELGPFGRSMVTEGTPSFQQGEPFYIYVSVLNELALAKCVREAEKIVRVRETDEKAAVALEQALLNRNGPDEEVDYEIRKEQGPWVKGLTIVVRRRGEEETSECSMTLIDGGDSFRLGAAAITASFAVGPLFTEDNPVGEYVVEARVDPYSMWRRLDKEAEDERKQAAHKPLVGSARFRTVPVVKDDRKQRFDFTMASITHSMRTKQYEKCLPKIKTLDELARSPEEKYYAASLTANCYRANERYKDAIAALKRARSLIPPNMIKTHDADLIEMEIEELQRKLAQEKQ